MIYTPALFREDDLSVAHALIRRYSFGTLVCRLDGQLEATHVPFLIDPERGAKGTLAAHVSRANPIWRGVGGADDVLAIFTGPHAYVSPAWYVNADNVPTWNYVAVHATGRGRIVEGVPATLDFLKKLVDVNEAEKMGPPWSMEKLPSGFAETLAREIVAFEIEIAEVVCKLKLSQNRKPEDRAGAIAGLRAQGGPTAVDVARLMRP